MLKCDTSSGKRCAGSRPPHNVTNFQWRNPAQKFGGGDENARRAFIMTRHQGYGGGGEGGRGWRAKTEALSALKLVIV